jgi:predicted hotdog family 3-hydroxylacyl-ACP dehydratase
MSKIGQSKIGQSEIGQSEIRQSEIRQSEIGQSEIEQSEINILELLPQQPPFVMVDRLFHYDDKITITGLTVQNDNLFLENGVLSEVGLVENVAQTCAARMGYINKCIYKNPVKIGVIGSIKNFIIEELPKVGEELKTTIEVMSEVFAITLVNAKVEVGGKLMASCEMKISITDIDKQ